MAIFINLCVQMRDFNMSREHQNLKLPSAKVCNFGLEMGSPSLTILKIFRQAWLVFRGAWNWIHGYVERVQALADSTWQAPQQLGWCLVWFWWMLNSLCLTQPFHKLATRYFSNNLLSLTWTAVWKSLRWSCFRNHQVSNLLEEKKRRACNLNGFLIFRVNSQPEHCWEDKCFSCSCCDEVRKTAELFLL